MRARQSPQARSRDKQGGDELYSQRLCAPGWAASQCVGWKKSKPKERLGVMRAHTAAKPSGAEARSGRTVRLDKA